MAPQDTYHQLLDALTEREVEVVDLIVKGLSNREIALDLSLSYETVKWYTKRIYSKLQVPNRARLMALVRQTTLQQEIHASRYSLPQMLTAFVGRQQEVAEISTRVNKNQLVTLVGAGGIGKTRLALEVGSRLKRDYHVLFIALHAVDSEDQFIEVLSDALGINLDGTVRPLEQLMSGIPPEPTLLILDNFESIIDSAPILPRLLQHTETLRIVVTSRAVLRLRGAFVYSVHGLGTNSDRTAGNSAVDLFCERARQHHSSFEPRSELARVRDICQMLDGSPLAIELAASWIPALTCEQICAELRRGLDILQGNLVDVDDRHRSMVAVCEQSWQLLTAGEQDVFQQLSIFSGGFSAEAAVIVADASLPLLVRLVDKSILSIAGGGRYQIHDVLRLFALERFERSEQVPLARERHACFFVNLLIDTEMAFRGSRQKQTLQLIKTEWNNITDAWRWSVRNGLHDNLRRAMQPLASFLEITDRSRQGSSLFALGLEHATPGTLPHAGFLMFRGWHEIWLGNTQAGTSDMFNALAMLDALDARVEWAMPMSILSFNESFDTLTRDLLWRRYETARQFYLDRDDHWNAGWMAYGMGNIARTNDALKDSQALLKSSLARFQSVGDLYGQAWALDALSTTFVRMKHYDKALDTTHRLKAISDFLSYNTGRVIALERLGDIAQLQGKYQDSYTAYLTALEYAVENANATTIVPLLLNLAKLIATHSTLPGYIAAEMLAMVKSHPSSQQGWFADRHREAAQWLERLADDDPSSGYYAAIVRGQSSDLLKATKHLLDDVLPDRLDLKV